MRIMIQGGYWKNTEDEILKAAVMKYGLNQWARISSLLARKSAKQCKARWYEWLDPSIKKTEWSQEEDEKLLHLAKILPTQWRTIAPIVGRTAAQCLERYEFLLDTAQQKFQIEDTNSSHARHSEYDDPRRLRPGEIDPRPETKPARPDPIDMDEDEKEMLSEARARLANTKGKKAKRKAREKQLEQARRLATLQKKRELKAAGIHVSKRRRRKSRYLDYNLEIPFYRQAPRGFYNTKIDDKRADQLTKEARTNFQPRFITEIEGERRDEIEERERRKDIARQKLLRKNNLPAAIMRLNRMNDPINTTSSMRRQKSMNLPMPQISEQELDDIAKITQKSQQNAQQSQSGLSVTAELTAGLYPSNGGTNNNNENTSGDASNASNARHLSGIHSVPMSMLRQRTPQHSARTPANRSNHIMEQASDLWRMVHSQTPLHGGSNPELIGNQDWSGVTPKQSVMRTPNPLSTPGNHSSAGAGHRSAHANSVHRATPKSQGMRTPSHLGLNTPQSIIGGSAPYNASAHPNASASASDSALTLASAQTPAQAQALQQQQNMLAAQSFAESRKSMKKLRKRIRNQLSKLPPANNEYEIALPPMPTKPFTAAALLRSDFALVEDKFDTDIRLENERIALAFERRQKQTQVIQQRLPRPQNLNLNSSLNKNFTEYADRSVSYKYASDLIHNEMQCLLFVDHKNHPCHRSDNERTQDKDRDTDTTVDGLLNGKQNKKNKKKNKKKKKDFKIERKNDFTLDELEHASNLMDIELKKINIQHQHEVDDGQNRSGHGMHMGMDLDVFEDIHNKCVFVPRLERYAFVSNKKGFLLDKLNAKKQEFTILRNNVGQYMNKCDKKEQKLVIKCKGFRTIEYKLRKTIADNHEKINECNDQIYNYQILLDRERKVIPQRIQYYDRLLAVEKDREQQLQQTYQQLLQQRNEMKTDS